MTSEGRGRARISLVDLQRIDQLLERVADDLGDAGLNGLAEAVERQRGRVKRIRSKVAVKLLRPTDYGDIWRQSGGVG